MKLSRIHILPLALLAALSVAPVWGADDGVSVGFSQPGQPRTLRIDVPMADITVTGGDGDQVVVFSDVPSAKPEKRKDGLRVIASGAAFDLVEKDNVVTLSQDHSALRHGGGNFKVQVPRDVKLVCRVEIDGDLRVKDVAGDLDVSNINGSIKLDNVSGSVSAQTMNGEIEARYTKVAADKVHAFASMNGQIDLFVPADTKATFRLRAQNGTVATDLDEQAFVTRTEAGDTGGSGDGKTITIRSREARVAVDQARAEVDRARAEIDRARAEADVVVESSGNAPAAPRPPKPPKIARVTKPTFPSYGGQVVVGTFNGGGVEVRANTMNGEIRIRQAK